jgi:hypothetical protein
MPAIAKRKAFVSELDHLRHCEAIVKKGSEVFLEVGNALAEIRDQKLWKHADPPEGEADYASFDDYRDRKWGFTERHVRQIRQDSDTVNRLDRKHASAITSQRQATALSRLPEDQRAGVIEAIQAEGKPLTARAIKEAAAKILPDEPDDSTLSRWGGDDRDDDPAGIEGPEQEEAKPWLSNEPDFLLVDAQAVADEDDANLRIRRVREFIQDIIDALEADCDVVTRLREVVASVHPKGKP